MRGWPWYRLRAAGGRLVRITVHGAQATTEGTYTAMERAVASLPDRPGPWVF